MIGLHPFTSALIGGGLIGFSVVWLMWSNGRIAGVSGVLAGLLRFDIEEIGWRFMFLLGLVGSSWLLWRLTGVRASFTDISSPALAIAAGAIVGVGTQLGNGCTSGHGVCGISRFSVRSIAATATFMATGILTVFFVRHVFGA